MNSSRLQQQVDALTWFQCIDLGNGIITKGTYDTQRKLRLLQMPSDLTGWSVLDIGAWDGFFSFEAEKRHAQRVVALDHIAWSGQDWGSKKGFELVRSITNSRVEDIEMDVMEMTPQKPGTFDLVLFLGVLYHLKHPLLSLEKIFAVTRKLLILETEIDFLYIRRPVLAFYPANEASGDPSNWCSPNPACLINMLKTVGFSKVDIILNPRPLAYRLARALFNMYKGRPPDLHRSRMIVHAWR
jgi:tRNA (mo5U34)-methyltransferase